MQVDTALALRVLAHELRSPAGVAQGYVRLLIDGRLDPDDRQRALESIRDALGRIGLLSRQASEMATLLEHPPGGDGTLSAQALLDKTVAEIGATQRLETTMSVDPAAQVRSTHAAALARAIASFVEATARERAPQTTALQATTTATHLDVLACGPDHAEALAAGPDGPRATSVALERGGMGLALVTAFTVLASHAARTWTVDDVRGACGIRLPLLS